MPDYAKESICNLLHEHIDADSQRLIGKYPGYRLQAITILQYKCADINLAYQRIYNISFQKVLHKGRKSKINYIKIFQNAKDLEI